MCQVDFLFSASEISLSLSRISSSALRISFSAAIILASSKQTIGIIITTRIIMALHQIDQFHAQFVLGPGFGHLTIHAGLDWFHGDYVLKEADGF